MEIYVSLLSLAQISVLTMQKTRKRKSKDNFVKIRVSNITSNGQTEAVEFSQSFQFAEDHKSEIREILNEFAPHSKGLLLVWVKIYCFSMTLK